MSTRRKGTPKPTWTSLVLDALIKSDDFMTLEQIRAAVNAPTDNLTRATVYWLRKFKVIDSVVGGDGKLWWFATPGDDQRTKQLMERVPEDCPRAPRRGRKIKPKE